MKEMRIVALNEASREIWVQNKAKFNKWEQVIMKEEDFEKKLKEEFTSYYEEFKKSFSPDLLNYFYYYGEDGKETYIFKG